MLLPSKVTSYRESILPEVIYIISKIEHLQHCNIMQLYNEIKPTYPSLNDFIDALIFLYAISKINFDNSSLEIIYAS